MASALEARLTRLESKTDQTSGKFAVVADETEYEARIDEIAADTVVIITGVRRARPPQPISTKNDEHAPATSFGRISSSTGLCVLSRGSTVDNRDRVDSL
jgi:hypothetical protein